MTMQERQNTGRKKFSKQRRCLEFKLTWEETEIMLKGLKALEGLKIQSEVMKNEVNNVSSNTVRTVHDNFRHMRYMAISVLEETE